MRTLVVAAAIILSAAPRARPDALVMTDADRMRVVAAALAFSSALSADSVRISRCSVERSVGTDAVAPFGVSARLVDHALPSVEGMDCAVR